ncbi:hypothetical protein [Streptomyces sp. NPDC087294]|uniref:hypothetical protein n=1 Tax=Streptomyces sp. NPDC087294 TaxID=3365777 RepID=UPI0037FF49F3
MAASEGAAFLTPGRCTGEAPGLTPGDEARRSPAPRTPTVGGASGKRADAIGGAGLVSAAREGRM